MLSQFYILFSLHLLCWAQGELYAVKFNSAFYYEEFSDMPATFGPNIDGTLRGLLVNASPPDACTNSLIPPPPLSLLEDLNKNILGKWFLLVPRYTNELNCTFEEKIRMAQSKGYNAVIVHNVGSEELISMSAKNTTGINIPSVFISQTSGLMLGESFATDDYFIMITAQSPFDIKTHLLIPFAIVVGICFFVMVVFMVVKYIKERRRQRRHRLPTSQLNKIPTRKYEKGDRYDMCAICLDNYIEGEKLRVLPCNHVYHTKCIDPWLTKNKRVCPICKRKVFAHNEPLDSDSASDSDSDDTTPLMRSGTRVTQGGTFEIQNENPIQRAARSVSQQSGVTNFVTSSDAHSINAERLSTASSDNESSYNSTRSTTSSSNTNQNSKATEVHVHHQADTDSQTSHNEINI